MPSFFGTASGLLILALCYSSIDYALRAASFYNRARSWYVTNGNLTTRRLADELDPDGAYATENSFCDVQYNYSVAGISYSGQRANIWGYIDEVRFCDFMEVKARAADVNVFYNPHKPEESVLDRRIRPWSLGSIIFTVVLLAYGSFMVLLFDNVFEKLPQRIVSLISFNFALFLLLFCQRVQKLTHCTAAICIGFSSAVFTCFAFTFWLLWIEGDESEREWINQRDNDYLSIAYGA